MFQYSFIDLDATIFETPLLARDMRKIFGRYNVTDADFDASMELAVRDRNYFYDYTFEKQIGQLKKMGYRFTTEIVAQLNNLFQKNYRAPGAEEFLIFLRRRSERMILLSAGNLEFQRRKISSADFEKFFDEIHILHGNKDAFVRQKINGKDAGLFVNDNVRENIIIRDNFATVTVISKVNPRKKTQEYRDSGIPYFDNLSGIQQYVEQKLA